MNDDARMKPWGREPYDGPHDRMIGRIESERSYFADMPRWDVEKITFSMKVSIQEKLMNMKNLKERRAWYADYLASTKQKYLITFGVDVAAMGQRWRGLKVDPAKKWWLFNG